MSVIPFSKARSHLTDIVNEVAYGGERVILTRKGKKLVAIISLDDFEIFEALEDQLDLSVAELVDKDIKKHGTIPWDEAKRKLKL